MTYGTVLALAVALAAPGVALVALGVARAVARAAPLSTTDLSRLAEADEEVYALHGRVEYTPSCSVSRQTGTGAARTKTPLEQRLVPSPAGV